MRFVENAGQWDSRVRFRAESGGLELLLTDDGCIARFAERIPADADKSAGAAKSAAVRALEPRVRPDDRVVGAALAFRPAGAARTAPAPGLRVPGETNYLIGNDPSQWRRGVAAYDSVVYHDWLPGVDVRFLERDGIPTYDILLAPGASPDSVAFEWEGADSLEVDADGHLVAKTKVGELRHLAPSTYEIGEAGERRALASRFKVLADGKVGFAVTGRNPARRLVIDPGIVYSTFVGGSSLDAGFGIANDTTGNAYVTGYTVSTNFPVTTGAFDTSLNFSYDAYVSKIAADGSAYIYSTYLGGAGVDQGLSITVDSTGAAYVVGTTLSINFPTTINAYDKTFGFGFVFGDCFVTKLAPSGNTLVFSTYLGGNGDDVALRVRVDGANNVYIAGWTRSTDFITPVTAGTAFDNSYNGTAGSNLGDAFFAELNPAGSALLYATLLGGPSSDGAAGMAIDSQGHVVITGLAHGGFPKKGTPFNTFMGGADLFVASIDPTLSGQNSLLFSAILGGANDDFGNALDIDSTDAIYVAGCSESGAFPTVGGSFDTTFNGGGADAIVLKMSSTGSQLGYSTFLGGGGADTGTGIVVDAAGAAYVSGRTNSQGFPTTPGALKTKNSGKIDGFLSKLSPSGAVLLTSGYIGGSANDDLSSLSLVAENIVWVVGTTASVNFPVTSDAIDKTINAQDGIVAKVDLGPAPLLALDSTAPIQVIFDTGTALPVPSVILALTNAGSPESILHWHVSENPAAPWLSETPDNGSSLKGDPATDVTVAFDATGLTDGAYNTTMSFTNDDNPNDIIDVPVLLTVQDIITTPILGGDTITGAVDFAGEIDVASFTAVKGETLTLKFTSVSGDIAPKLTIRNNIGQAVYTASLKHNTKPITKSYKFTTDGDFSLVVSGTNPTTGSFSSLTSVKFPADAKKFTKKNKAPKVNGAPVDFPIRMIAGATLDATVVPVKTLTNALAITLLDPTQTPIDVTANTQPFDTTGLQLVGVPIVLPGLYTLRITGPATTKEKVNVTATPTQPIGVAVVPLP
jgi:hypothetical protein